MVTSLNLDYFYSKLFTNLYIFLSKPVTIFGSGLALAVVAVWLLGNSIAQQLEPPTSVKLPQLQQLDHPNISPIVTTYLFGKPTVKSTPDLHHITASRLDLSLVGVIETGKRSLAIIKKQQQTLSVLEGETIQPGVTLLRVYNNEAIISNHGSREKLVLKNALADSLLSHESESQLTPTLNENQKGQLKTAIQLVKRSPLTITQYVSFRLLNINGKPSGLKIFPTQDIALFNALGFESGDVITQVNGHSVSELAANPKMMQNFTQTTHFSIQINRDGAVQSLDIDLNSLTL